MSQLLIITLYLPLVNAHPDSLVPHFPNYNVSFVFLFHLISFPLSQAYILD